MGEDDGTQSTKAPSGTAIQKCFSCHQKKDPAGKVVPISRRSERLFFPRFSDFSFILENAKARYWDVVHRFHLLGG